MRKPYTYINVATNGKSRSKGSQSFAGNLFHGGHLTSGAYRSLADFSKNFMTPAYESRFQTGIDKCDSHHGEWIQLVIVILGELIKVLVTCSCSMFKSLALFIPDSSGLVKVIPHDRLKSKTAAELTLKKLGKAGLGGTLFVWDNIPLRIGCGSSTSNLIAVIRAVANACGYILDPAIIATIAVEAEKYSDSTMFNEVVLFAFQKGEVLEVFGPKVPEMKILGINTDSRGIETNLMRRPVYSKKELYDFQEILSLFRHGMKISSSEYIARAATWSALINQRYHPKRHFDDLIKIIEDQIALGLQISHSGSVLGLIFNSKDPELTTKMNHAIERLKAMGINSYRTFNV